MLAPVGSVKKETGTDICNNKTVSPGSDFRTFQDFGDRFTVFVTQGNHLHQNVLWNTVIIMLISLKGPGVSSLLLLQEFCCTTVCSQTKL